MARERRMPDVEKLLAPFSPYVRIWP